MAAFEHLADDLDVAMVVVTVADPETGERGGCLVGFHCQCSIEPERYAVWVSRANHTRRIADRSTHMAVHFLDAGQRPLAEHFGALTGDEVDKLAGVACTEGPGGIPLLDDVAHRIVGRVAGRYDTGADHTFYELEPVASTWNGRLTPLRFTAAKDIDAGHAAEEAPG